MTEPRRSRLLRVDLAAGTAEREPIPERWRRRYVGGKGLGARYLYEELAPGVDPLGPENVLLFALGPVTGLAPGDATCAVVTKSPLTGTFLDSYVGGAFPARLAGALADCLAVLVEGASDDPVTLRIDGEDARLEPAGDLWGLDVVETTDALLDAEADRSNVAPSARAVACIGPAGESRVRYATVAADGGDHQAGRGGAGAVLGAKGLKAVVAEGPRPTGLDALRSEYERRHARTDSGRWYGAGGTMETVDFAAETGVLPTRGWTDGAADDGAVADSGGRDGGAGVADGDRGAERESADCGGSGTESESGSRSEGDGAGGLGVGVEAVRAAAVARERESGALPGDFRVPADEGDGEVRETVPRGATPISLGSNLGIGEFDAVAALGGRCDRLGLDVISAGNAVAWAMRTGASDAEFGDVAAARGLLDRIARRGTPLADDLADGVAAAAARRGGEDAVPTVKAMSLSSYDPRGSPAMALAYATSDRGACHRRARPVVEEVFAVEEWSPGRRAAAVAAEQDLRSALWSLVVDDLAAEAFEADLGAEWLRTVGLDHDAADLRRVGERVWNLTRLFNAREGFGRADDALPPSLAAGGGSDVGGGSGDGDGDDESDAAGLDPDAFDRALDAYYERRGWDGDGVPTRATLRRLDLLAVVDGDDPG